MSQRHRYSHDLTAQDPETAGFVHATPSVDPGALDRHIKAQAEQMVEEEIAADLAAQEADREASVALVDTLAPVICQRLRDGFLDITRAKDLLTSLTPDQRRLLNMAAPGALRSAESSLAEACAMFLEHYYGRHGITFTGHYENEGRIWMMPTLKTPLDASGSTS